MSALVRIAKRGERFSRNESPPGRAGRGARGSCPPRPGPPPWRSNTPLTRSCGQPPPARPRSGTCRCRSALGGFNVRPANDAVAVDEELTLHLPHLLVVV